MDIMVLAFFIRGKHHQIAGFNACTNHHNTANTMLNCHIGYHHKATAFYMMKVMWIKAIVMTDVLAQLQLVHTQ